MKAEGATREPGLVLRPIRLGDSSKIVSVLTPNFGRVKLVAKGARRLGSRLAPLLEPGNELDLVFYPHRDRELWILGDGSLVRAALTGGDTLAKLTYLFAAMELADRLLPEREPVPEFNQLYREFVDAWHATADAGQPGLFFALELGLLEGAGIGLNVDLCSACGQDLRGADRAGVRVAEGAILCSGCAPGGTRWLDAEALGDLQALGGHLGCGPGKGPVSGGAQEPAVLGPQSRQQIGRMLHEHMTMHLPGYRLPQSLYWLAPGRGERGNAG